MENLKDFIDKPNLFLAAIAFFNLVRALLPDGVQGWYKARKSASEETEKEVQRRVKEEMEKMEISIRRQVELESLRKQVAKSE